jgi:CHAD domain-containing protein
MSHKAADSAKSASGGLSYWMEQVLAEADRAHRDLSADRVHDLRVALRRCRSMAEAYMAIDPDKGWRTLLKEGRQLFRRLGRLRDIQVLEEWIGRLGEPDDPVSMAMLFHLAQSERDLKRAAVAALQAFDRNKWRGLIRRLQARARCLPIGGSAVQLSALQAWHEAHALHRQALRCRSAVAYHRLRIGIKKFRYIVENFLPILHIQWGGNLKEIQDCLGEMHDLVVFWQTALRLRIFPDLGSRDRWRTLIAQEKSKRLGQYRAKMGGIDSLWNVWRLGLPPENQLPSVTLRTMEKRAFFQGINLTRARHVRRLALQIFNGLRRGKRTEIRNQRSILHLAAILQELGRAKSREWCTQASRSLRLGLPSAPGFTEESLLIAAMVIRGQRGKLQGYDWESSPSLSGDQQQLAMELGGILRLARVLSRDSSQTIRSLTVEQNNDSIIIFAAGYSELGPLAEKVAQARYLLECARQKPVILRSAPDNQDSAQRLE